MTTPTTRPSTARPPATLPPTGDAAARRTAYRVTFARVLRSEWHKLWSLRSTWAVILTSAALVLGVGTAMGATYTSDGGDSDVDTVVLVLYGTMLAQVVLAVLGILVTAGEYTTGMIRASLTAVPSRLPVLWAKAAVFTVTAFAVSLATALVTFVTAQLLLADTDQAASLVDPGVLRAITGNSAGITLVSLIALGIGAVVRSVPGSIGAFVGGVLVVPEILSVLPYEATDTALTYFPSQAAAALGSATPLPGAATPGAALLALTLWVGAALGAAGLSLKRRDV
ncbi:ABC transporter permease [Streptomyces sp. NPDC047928]|uniref:ABC transporter permease n=1 Tax=unclassified Streptomyces TaxID=2593676 RepID=UPI00371F8881